MSIIVLCNRRYENSVTAHRAQSKWWEITLANCSREQVQDETPFRIGSADRIRAYNLISIDSDDLEIIPTDRSLVQTTPLHPYAVIVVSSANKIMPWSLTVWTPVTGHDFIHDHSEGWRVFTA